jgi:tetratricopeptide (TPR) repeat protein
MEQLRNTFQLLNNGPQAGEAVIQFEIARTLNLIGSLLPLENQETAPESLMEVLPASVQQRFRLRQRLIDRRLATRIELVTNQKSIRQAIATLEKLIEAHGQQPQYVAEKAKSHARLAELLYHSDDMPASEEARKLAIVDLEWLVTTFPDEMEYQVLLAQVIVLPVSANYSDRAMELERASQLTSSLQEQRPRNLEFAQLDAECNYQLGQVYLAAKSIDSAIDAWQRTVESLSRVVSNSPENSMVQLRLAATTLELAEMLVENQRYDRARDLLRPATASMQRQLKSQRNGQAGRLVIARLYELLARSLEELGDDRGAKTALRQSMQFKQRADIPDVRQGNDKRPGPGNPGK